MVRTMHKSYSLMVTICDSNTAVNQMSHYTISINYSTECEQFEVFLGNMSNYNKLKVLVRTIIIIIMHMRHQNVIH